MEKMPIFSSEIMKSQKKYEKGVEKIISEPLYKRILKFLETEDFDSLKREKKGLAKEDVIKIDAILELGARKAAEGKDADSPEHLYLSRLLNSDVYLEETDEIYVDKKFAMYAESHLHEDFLIGEINGAKINILNRYIMKEETGEKLQFKINDKNTEPDYYSGDINGKEILDDEAKKIFENYGQIGKKRTDAINDFLKNEQESKIKENDKPAENFN